jgi:hypothetical protein
MSVANVAYGANCHGNMTSALSIQRRDLSMSTLRAIGVFFSHVIAPENCEVLQDELPFLQKPLF